MTTSHPAFAALSPWLENGIDALAVAELNAIARACAEPPRTDTGAAVRFVAPTAAISAVDYETRILSTGEVPTRPGNLHDVFNALCWVAFPEYKRACNALHAEYSTHAAAAPGSARGPVRDALTLLDESGVIVLCADLLLAKLLIDRQWKSLFWDRRAEVASALRFFVSGHALYEKLLRPYPGITARALIISAPGALFDAGVEKQRRYADQSAARLVRAGVSLVQMPPLPLAGIPGWNPENDAPAFYDNRAVFRSSQSATAAGSEATSAQRECAPAPVNSSGVP